MSINIKCVITHPHGTCSFYRSMGPLSKIKGVTSEVIEKGNWLSLTNADIVYFERPWSDAHKEGIQYATAFNIPTWLDFDDDLFSIPSWNPSYKVYEPEKIKENIKEICKLASVITVTTEQLKTVYGQYNKNVIVVPNALNDYNFPWRCDNWNETNIFHWRGSKTHRGDLMRYRDEILDLYKTTPNHKWSWFGEEHWMITEEMKASEMIINSETEIVRYFVNTHNIKPSYAIVPLEDNVFNRGKSNIAWLEATWAGAITFAPDWEVWNQPGIINFKEGTFKESVRRVITDPKLCRKLWNESKDFIKENLLLSIVNQKRIDIVKDLLKND